jgi:hypothetical protein
MGSFVVANAPKLVRVSATSAVKKYRKKFKLFPIRVDPILTLINYGLYAQALGWPQFLCELTNKV